MPAVVAINPRWHPGGLGARVAGRYLKMSDNTPRVYLLPNLMTAGNLFCGFLAILRIFEGRETGAAGHVYYYQAIALILGACIFDLLDGRIARWSGQESKFGREFDSLADIVSFGIAPALLVMDIVLDDFSDRLGWLVAFAYLLCGAMRLARFNCMADEEDEGNSYFIGIPIPAAAGVIASMTLLMLWISEGEKEIGNWKYFLPVLMLMLSFLMFSELRYPSFKKVNWGMKRTLPIVFATIIMVLVTVLHYQWMPAVIFNAYMIYGLVRPWVSRRLRREIEQEDEEILEDEDSEESPSEELGDGRRKRSV